MADQAAKMQLVLSSLEMLRCGNGEIPNTTTIIANKQRSGIFSEGYPKQPPIDKIRMIFQARSFSRAAAGDRERGSLPGLEIGRQAAKSCGPLMLISQLFSAFQPGAFRGAARTRPKKLDHSSREASRKHNWRNFALNGKTHKPNPSHHPAS
jgi:hypothetical protein